MELSNIRKYRKKRRMLPDLLAENPLLFLGFDLPFLVITAVSLKNAAALAIEMLFIHLITMLVAWFLAPRFKVSLRILLTTTVATIVMMLSRELVLYLIPSAEGNAGMYLYLMAVNGLTLFQSAFLSPKAKLLPVAQTALLNIVAFTGIVAVVSAIREYFGNGTLWEIPLPNIGKLSGFTAPFFGFILMGFLLAGARFVNRKLSEFSILERHRQYLAAQEGGAR